MDGGLLPEPADVYPDLLADLEANPWKCITEEEYQNMLIASSGTGGGAYYVWDKSANTIRVPFIQNDFICGGEISSIVTRKGDALRNITGNLHFERIGAYTFSPVGEIQFSDKKISVGCLDLGQQQLPGNSMLILKRNDNVVYQCDRYLINCTENFLEFSTLLKLNKNDVLSLATMPDINCVLNTISVTYKM